MKKTENSNEHLNISNKETKFQQACSIIVLLIPSNNHYILQILYIILNKI